ncbi:MAG TPA: hypothetical protein VFM98_23275 [Ramlibacter sp.]|uniref:hypothetical protein n=1 Tax=Ramlibacter sp. TaxID=1917967 RepID=UPI002D8023DC|nr:hypothetical protein [Ramlibacter sp.]HET8748536.1 hypothetical protein [Ramlibacter sp.]
MPHPRKHMKLSGDLHPPEVEDYVGAGEREGADEGEGEPVRSGATEAAAPHDEGAGRPPGRAVPAVRTLVVSMPSRQYVDAARAQVRERPLFTAAAAFFAGFAIGVITRSR